jgi:hypothetical protein
VLLSWLVVPPGKGFSLELVSFFLGAILDRIVLTVLKHVALKK